MDSHTTESKHWFCLEDHWYTKSLQISQPQGLDKVKQEQPIIRHYKNCNKLKFLWNFSYMVHLFLRFRKSGTLENILGSSKCKVPWSFASWYQLTAQNPDVIPDTMTFPKQTKKKDFTNELIPKGKKVIPVTIKSIFRNIANLFKAPTSRRKKWYEPEITILFLKIFTENCSGTHIFG